MLKENFEDMKLISILEEAFFLYKDIMNIEKNAKKEINKLRKQRETL